MMAVMAEVAPEHRLDNGWGPDGAQTREFPRPDQPADRSRSRNPKQCRKPSRPKACDAGSLSNWHRHRAAAFRSFKLSFHHHGRACSASTNSPFVRS